MAEKVVEKQAKPEISSMSMSHVYEGPLPAPSDFAAYKETMPDAPGRIVRMAEEEQEYRHKLNNKVVNYGLVESILGMCFALVSVLSCVAAAVYLGVNGHEAVSVALIGVLGTLAAIFYLKRDPDGK